MAGVSRICVALVFALVQGLAYGQGFVDVTAQTGLSATGSYGWVNLDRGAASLDLDGDGDQDFIIAPLPGQGFRAWRNEGALVFTEITATAGLGTATKARACVAADVDDDGDVDLYVTQTWAPNLLFLNDGTGAFTEAGAVAGVDDPDNGFCAAFGDFDRDGRIDLYVGNHSTQQSAPQANRLFRNLGGGVFADVTAAAGVADPGGRTFATTFFDYDDDGWPDLFVANDWYNNPGLAKNTTYRNNGDGTFTEVSTALGTGLGIQSMGVDFADVWNDGGWDVFVTNVEAGHVFHEWSPAQQAYQEQATTYGIQANQLGWAAHFLDYDNDGWQDLYVNHHRAYSSPGTNLLLRNPGAPGVFAEMGGALGLGAPGRYFTSAISDVDDDGRLDILQLDSLTGLKLFQNTTPPGTWLKVAVSGSRGNRSAIGAVVTVTAGGVVQRRAVRAGTGFLSSSDPRLHFGLGGATNATVAVRWPSGQEQTLTGVQSGQILSLTEPRLSIDLPPQNGTTRTVQVGVPGEAGLAYQMGISASSSGLVLPDGRPVPCAWDVALSLTLTPGNPILPASAGILDINGAATSPLHIPADPSLIGLTFYATAVSLDPLASAGVRTIIDPALILQIL